MEFVVFAVLLYVLLIWMPVDWVLGSELSSIARSRVTWLRRAILSSIRFRVVQRGRYWGVEARALYLTPYRRVILCGSNRGSFISREEAEHAVECVQVDIRCLLRGLK